MIKVKIRMGELELNSDRCYNFNLVMVDNGGTPNEVRQVGLVKAGCM